MSHYARIIAQAADIRAVATSRVRGMVKGFGYARTLSANVRAESRRRAIRYVALRERCKMSRVRFARLWFGGYATVPEVYRVQVALGCSAKSIWAVS